MDEIRRNSISRLLEELATEFGKESLSDSDLFKFGRYIKAFANSNIRTQCVGSVME